MSEEISREEIAALLARESEEMTNEEAFDIKTINEIKQIIDECEYIQSSNESEYTKEQSKISAYDHIKELMEDNNNDR